MKLRYWMLRRIKGPLYGLVVSISNFQNHNPDLLTIDLSTLCCYRILDFIAGKS
jgi:hypothetical protein